MTAPYRVVHYLNQFFAGQGGEELAHVGVSLREGPLGPGRALEQAMGGRGRVAATLVCGDNFLNERPAEALAAIRGHLVALRPELVIAGPAFGSGRYGMACAQVCGEAKALGIPAVTALHRDSPAVHAWRREVVIVPTTETAAGMAEALAQMVRLAEKLTRGEALGPAEIEGHISNGMRRVHDRGRPGYLRTVEMLLAKVRGEPYTTEVPIYRPEQVPAAPALADVRSARVAMVTTGGLVRHGNPEKQVSANATRYHRHSVKELQSLSGQDWEVYHAGYFNAISNANPNYILPLQFLRDLERRGEVGGLYEWMYALPGVSTSVANSQGFGRHIARDLAADGVQGVLLVAT